MGLCWMPLISSWLQPSGYRLCLGHGGSGYKSPALSLSLPACYSLVNQPCAQQQLWGFKIWLSDGLGSAVLTVGLNNLKSIFQLLVGNGSVILCGWKPKCKRLRACKSHLRKTVEFVPEIQISKSSGRLILAEEVWGLVLFFF